MWNAFRGLSTLGIPLVIAVLAWGADPPAGAKPLSAEKLGAIHMCYQTAWDYTCAAVGAVVEPENIKSVNYSMENAQSNARRLGVTLKPIPAFRREGNPPPSQLQLLQQFRDGAFADAAAQIEKKWGPECRRLFDWAWVLESSWGGTDSGNRWVYPVPNKTIVEWVEKYTSAAGLPKELGAPLLLAAKTPGADVAQAVAQCRTRKDFFVAHVLTGEFDVTVLADPEFDTNRETLLVARVNKQEDADLEKQLKVQRTPLNKAALLLVRLEERHRIDPNDFIGRNLRELRPETIQAAFVLSGLRQSPPVSPKTAFTAIDVVVFKKTLKEVRDGISAETIKAWDGSVADIISCLNDKQSEIGARFALAHLSLLSDGKPIKSVAAARASAQGTPSADSLDLALEQIARAHWERACKGISDYVIANPNINAVPASVSQIDLAAIRDTGEFGRNVLGESAKVYAKPANYGADPAGEDIRIFLEEAGTLPATPAEVRAERKRAVSAWAKAAKNVNTNGFPFTNFKKVLSDTDARIGALEEMLGGGPTGEFTEKFKAPSALGLGFFVTEMQHNAAAAGRFAANQAMVRDFRELLKAREGTVMLYLTAFELEASRFLSPDERALAVKHGLMSTKGAVPLQP